MLSTPRIEFLIVAVVFSTMAGVPRYVEAVTPWFVVLIVALFFILIIIGLSQQKISSIMKPGFVWVFIVLLILVFLVAYVKLKQLKAPSSSGQGHVILNHGTRVRFPVGPL